MPRLDKNGLMAGSAERCENSQLAAWLKAMPLGGACANREASNH